MTFEYTVQVNKPCLDGLPFAHIQPGKQTQQSYTYKNSTKQKTTFFALLKKVITKLKQ